MIIDLILDRKDGNSYNAREFYFSVLEYGGPNAERITRAMDSGTEQHVKHELCAYILENDYSPEICDYINGQSWL